VVEEIIERIAIRISRYALLALGILLIVIGIFTTHALITFGALAILMGILLFLVM